MFLSKGHVEQFNDAPDPRKYARNHLVSGVIVKTLWRPQVFGKENIPITGPFIFGPKHSSLIDPWLIGTQINRATRFMARSEIWTDWRYKLIRLGEYANKIGGFPVNKNASIDTTSIKTALQIIRDHHPLMMYSEGTSLHRGKNVGEIMGGVALLAIKAAQEGIDCPVLVAGSTTERPYLLRPLYVVIPPPIYPDINGVSLKAARLETTERIYDALQDSYTKALDLREQSSTYTRLLAQMNHN